MARLTPNKPKIVEALLFLIEEAAVHGRTLTQYDLVKSIFIADYWHLRKFGRPISFDNYVAMKFGPVPSATYDMLKPRSRLASMAQPLWDRVAEPGSNVAQFKNPRRAANRKKLSESDIGQLREALTFVLSQGFTGVKDWTHSLESYTDAWESRGDRGSNEMRYEMLLEVPDRDLVSDIAHASKYM